MKGAEKKDMYVYLHFKYQSNIYSKIKRLITIVLPGNQNLR